ncbi:MAG: hypothetical protein ABIU20_09690 [Blastocatellia bacterium]
MNETAATLIKIGGIANIGWFVFHCFFWRLFNWGSQLKRLNDTNRGVMQVLNLCLSFIFLIFAAVSLLYAEELCNSGLGRVMLIGIGGFWILRLIEQPIFFGVSRISNLFSLLFAATAACYLTAWALR